MRRDGNWWIGQDRLARLNYTVGLFDGMGLGYKFSYWRFVDDQKSEDARRLVQASFTYYSSRYIQNLTSGQVVDGLDVFYADFKNRNILTQNAMWIVANQISGMPAAEVEKLIESWRRSSTP